MEVVLADGRVVRTGMGAMTGNSAWQMYKGGFGPSLDGLFLQSNYGVVTKMGVWMMPAPEQAIDCFAPARNEDDLAAVIDTLRPPLLDGTISANSMVGNALAVASVITDVVRDDVSGVRSYLLHCERSSGQYLWDALLDAGSRSAVEVTGFRGLR